MQTLKLIKYFDFITYFNDLGQQNVYNSRKTIQEAERFWTALEVIFISMQITYAITHSIELKYPDFFLPLFDLIRFILYYFVQAELFYANLRFQKEKNFEETLCSQPRQFVSISLHLRLYANYC